MALLKNVSTSISTPRLLRKTPSTLNGLSLILRTDYDEHGNITFKGIEGIELGILTPAEITPTQDGKAKAKMKYEKIGEIKRQN